MNAADQTDVISREEAERKLKHDGDFIVRLSWEEEKKQAVLSYMREGRADHVILKPRKGSGFTLGEFWAPTVHELIKRHVQESIPVVQGDKKALIRKGVRREEHIILHSAVEENELLGEGQFGQVTDSSDTLVTPQSSYHPPD